MMNQKYLNLWVVFAIGLLTFFVLHGLAEAASPKFMVFTNEPLENTYKTVYPEIQEFYQSDNKLTLVAEIEPPFRGKFLSTIQIQNANGEKVFNEQKDCEMSSFFEKPYVYYAIVLDQALKSTLSPGPISIKLSIGDKNYATKQIIYHNYNALNEKAAKVIILPFYSPSDQIFDIRLKNNILSTFSDALYLEIQRFLHDVMPANISSKNLSALSLKGCFEKASCRNEIKTIFGDGVFVTGVVTIPKIEKGIFSSGSFKDCMLEIHVYDAQKGEIKTFRSNLTSNPGDNEIDIMKILLKNVLYQEGFLSYMRAL